jgi:hypothetical protein
LDVDVQAGPYKGIFTTKERDTFVRVLSSDISAIAKQDDKSYFLKIFLLGIL